MKTSELTGALLDYWVAMAEGWDFFWSKHNHWIVTRPNERQYQACQGWCPFDPASGKRNKIPHPSEALEDFYPSTDWSIAGPIIERERIHIAYMPSDAQPDVPRWYANLHSRLNVRGGTAKVGPTILIAAMRCYVASKFGNEVPDDIAKQII